MIRSSDLLVHVDGAIVAGDSAPRAGELAVFCRRVVTAPAVVRRDGTVLAGAWLPDLVRLGEMERQPVHADERAEPVRRKYLPKPGQSITDWYHATKGIRPARL